jgi:hypothetical protein
MAAEHACGFDAVNVTVTKLRFHKSATAAASDPGWTEIALQPARRINIAQMNNGALESLSSAALVPGYYAQTRLVLDPNNNNDTTNSVVPAGSSTEVPLQTQTIATEGISLGQGFDLANGQNMTLIADIDACRSVVPSGANRYLLRPIVKALPTVKNGITGFVDTSLMGSNVLVTAQQNGAIVRATAPDPATGEFKLTRLDPGAYDVVVTANGRAAAVITTVPVASALSTTALSTAAAPITMAPSATGHISVILKLTPSSTIQPPFGSARQDFASGVSAVIGFRVGNLETGEATFPKLPMAAPQVAAYRAASVLSFSPQADVFPAVASYSIRASAPGYATEIPATKPAIAD